MAKWLKSVMYACLTAIVIGCGGWVLSHETKIEVIREKIEAQQKNNEDQCKRIDKNVETIEKLQKTQNATHETVTIIKYELKDLKDDIDKELSEIKQLIRKNNVNFVEKR